MSRNRAVETSTTPESRPSSSEIEPVSVLLMAYSPADSTFPADRWELKEKLTVGRKPSAILPIQDEWMSGIHFQIVRHDNAFYVDDMGSTNGTYVNGLPLVGRCRLKDSSIIRAGRTIFVYHDNRPDLLAPMPNDAYGIGGRFHVGPLLNRIQRLAESGSNVLLSGPSGAGKELAAQAFAKMAERELLAQNAASLSGDSASAMLFGVGEQVFTDVADRPGLIEFADHKVLFLDEAHSLPRDVQRKLLRVFEDYRVVRIGEAEGRTIDVRFVLASNDISAPHFGLEHDLFARLYVLEVPSLKERLADIPSIFRFLLKMKLDNAGIKGKPVFRQLTADHYECMCLDGFEEQNTRGMIRLVDDLVYQVKVCDQPSDAIKSVIKFRYRNGPVFSRHKVKNAKNKTDGDEEIAPINDLDISLAESKSTFDSQTLSLIKEAYFEQRGIVSDIVKYLRDSHKIRTSHRRVSNALDALGLARVKRRRLC